MLLHEIIDVIKVQALSLYFAFDVYKFNRQTDKLITVKHLFSQENTQAVFI